MKQITFITGNQMKFDAAERALNGTSITLERLELDTPEIQSTSVEEIASFSARWVSDKLNKPVVVTDAGYYINALNGFPGPFIKYINKWLTADDLLKLMEGKSDRSVVVKDCLAYAMPGEEPITILGTAQGTISEKVVMPGVTPISTIFIPEGFDKTEPELGEEIMKQFWSDKLQNFQKLSKYLIQNEK